MSLPILTAKLPSLANTCLMIGHGRKADIVWTREQFMGLCEHLLNGNPPTDFLLAFPRPEGDPREPYAKSKNQRMEKRAAWAWDHVIGRAKRPCGIGFYPTNPEGKTRWGAMDFDSHDGDHDRARRLALAAFEVLLRNPELFLILATSGGGGWHLFVLTSDFHPVDEWTRMFRQAAEFIGAPVQKGLLEIFPNDGRGLGNAIRVPGTWHPKRNTFSLIVYEGIQPFLRCAGEERDRPFLNQSTHREEKSQFTEQGDSRCEVALRKFAISQSATRHHQLVGLVSELYRFYSRPIIESLVRRQFEAKNVQTEADAQKHMAEFGEVWNYWIARYRDALSAPEIEKESLLSTDAEKEAFRLAWGFANIKPGRDFAYSTEYFARNLRMTIPGVSKQRQKFCALGILEQTARFIPNKAAARFKWIATAETPF